MGTATLRSILERMVVQIIKVSTTDKRPNHKNPQDNIAFIKRIASVKAATLNPLSVRALFLKQN